MGRFAEPDELAAAVAFLASDDASFITASTFLVDGGISSGLRHPAVMTHPDRTAWPAMRCCARYARATRSRTPSGGCCRRSGSASRTRGIAAAGTRTRGPARVSRDTVREAIKSLADAGYLVSRRGRYGGTFLADELPTHSAETGGARVLPAQTSTTRWAARDPRGGRRPDGGGRTLTAAEREMLWARLTDVRGAAPAGLPPAGLTAAPGDRGSGRGAVAGAAGGREPDAGERATGSNSAAAAKHRALRRATRGDRDGDPGRRPDAAEAMRAHIAGSAALLHGFLD